MTLFMILLEQQNKYICLYVAQHSKILYRFLCEKAHSPQEKAKLLCFWLYAGCPVL